MINFLDLEPPADNKNEENINDNQPKQANTKFASMNHSEVQDEHIDQDGEQEMMNHFLLGAERIKMSSTKTTNQLTDFDPHLMKKELMLAYDYFKNQEDFSSYSIFSHAAQGIRFRFDRQPTEIMARFILISRRGGLIKPGFLYSRSKLSAKSHEIFNQYTGQVIIQLNQIKKGTWRMNVKEKNDIAGADIVVEQKGEERVLTYAKSKDTCCSISFLCPAKKMVLCGSQKPTNLLNIQMRGELYAMEFEENPNCNTCENDFELNLFMNKNIPCEDFYSLVSLLQIAADELKQ